MTLKTKRLVSVVFRCGHHEKIAASKLQKQVPDAFTPYTINSKLFTSSGMYCLECSKQK